MRYRSLTLIAIAWILVTGPGPGGSSLAAPGHPQQGPRSPHPAQSQPGLADASSLAATSAMDASEAYRLRLLHAIPALKSPGSQLGEELPSIEITADDRVFIADPHGYRICRYDLSGTQQACFGEEGKGAGQFLKINEMLLTPDDKLLVQDSLNDFLMTSRLQRFSLAGDFIDSRELPFVLEAVGPDGSLFGWNQARRIVRLSPTGQLSEFGLSGPEDPTPFTWPCDIRIDGQGQWFVADGHNAVVRRYDAQGHLLASWPQPDKTQDAFERGFSLRLLPNGHLLTVSPATDRDGVLGGRIWVRRLTSEGALLSTFRPELHETDSLLGPVAGSFATASDGSILILAGGGGSILQRHSSEGERLAIWLNKGGEREFLLPPALALFGNADGSVRSFGNSDGAWVDVSASGLVSGRGKLDIPPELSFEITDVARRPGGDHCAVGSSGIGWCFAANGSVRTRWRWREDSAGGASASSSLAAAADDSLWVTDPDEGILRHLDDKGTVLGETALPIPPELRFGICRQRGSFHLGLAVAPDGTVWVAEQCYRPLGLPEAAPGVHRVSATGAHLDRREIPQMLGLDPSQQEATVTDLAFTPSGRLLLATSVEGIVAPFGDRIWLFDAEGAAQALDPGTDPSSGLPIHPLHLTSAGEGRLWSTRGENLADYGSLDAFALELASDSPPTASPTPVATEPSPPSPTDPAPPPATPTPKEPLPPGKFRILLPVLEGWGESSRMAGATPGGGRVTRLLKSSKRIVTWPR